MSYMIEDFIRVYEEEKYAIYPICYAYGFIITSLIIYHVYNNF